MSDSEYYNEKSGRRLSKENRMFDSDDEETFIRNKKEPKQSSSKRNESDTESQQARNKKEPKQSSSKRNDSDTESQQTRGKGKNTKATAAKRKKPSVAASKKQDAWRTLDSESEDEESLNKQSTALRSSYSKKVADGVVRRTAQLSGDLFVEVKLYQTDDIKNVDIRKRYEKACLALKYQADHNAPELGLLRQFLKRCKTQFRDEGWFFADKDGRSNDLAK